MRLRRRRPEDGAGGNNNDVPGPGEGNLEGLRRAGFEFLRAGDEAINESLSRGNSEGFLESIRQYGGE